MHLKNNGGIIVSGFQESETFKKVSILEEVYKKFFETVAKEKNSLAVEPVIRLPSFLHYGATTEVPVTKERTIFFLPSIEGKPNLMGSGVFI